MTKPPDAKAKSEGKTALVGICGESTFLHSLTEDVSEHDDDRGPENQESAANSETGAKDGSHTATDPALCSGGLTSASEESPEDVDVNPPGPEPQQTVISTETGVTEDPNIALDPAIASDVVAGASDNSHSQQPGSPTLSAQTQDHDQSGMTPTAAEVTSALEHTSAISREATHDSNLAPPEESQVPGSPGDRTLVPDDGEYDEHVESAIKCDDYAPAFRLQLHKTTVGWPPAFGGSFAHHAM